MPRLVELGRALGYGDVWTYVNSGNVVLTTDRAPQEVEREVARALEEEYGASVDVMVRSAAELRTVLGANPFPDGPPSQVTVAFLTDAPPTGVQERLARVATRAEPFRLGDREIWVQYGDGQARSKLGAGFSRAVGVSATTRTVGTVSKIVAKIEVRTPSSA